MFNKPTWPSAGRVFGLVLPLLLSLLLLGELTRQQVMDATHRPARALLDVHADAYPDPEHWPFDAHPVYVFCARNNAAFLTTTNAWQPNRSPHGYLKSSGGGRNERHVTYDPPLRVRVLYGDLRIRDEFRRGLNRLPAHPESALAWFRAHARRYCTQ